MIEKIEMPEIDETYKSAMFAKILGNKINELVDAVNGILAAQEQYATIYNEDIVPMLTPENKEPADQFAEQRGWIGKVCWFWELDGSEPFADLLSSIDDTDNDLPYYSKNSGFWCKRCEPVKSTDSIIYKGNDNE